MWNYEKRLEYPINIKETNPALAKAVITQYGGPNGELGASMRYLAQRYTMPYKEGIAILTDIGTEAPEMFLSHLYISYHLISLGASSREKLSPSPLYTTVDWGS